MARRKKRPEETEEELETPVGDPEPKTIEHPQRNKGIPEGQMSFDGFFAYVANKHPNKVRPEHYRAMKVFLMGKNHAMIDSKENFLQAFEAYGLTGIE